MYLSRFKSGIIFAALLIKGTVGYASVAQICNQEICQPITSFEQESVLKKLTEMFKNNANQILVCSADASTKKCLNQPLTFNGQTNMLQVVFQVPFIRILQKERLENGFSLFLDYQLKANEKYPKCSPKVSHFTLFPKGEIRLTSPSFECHATELGNTFLAFQFRIDYINFDTGWLGASFEASSSGDVIGGGSGYVMMQLSSERSIQLKRLQPIDDGYHIDRDHLSGAYTSSHEAGKLVDWDKENIKDKWNSFKEKFLKILYLEPIDD